MNRRGELTLYIERPDGHNLAYSFTPDGRLLTQADGENKARAKEALIEAER